MYLYIVWHILMPVLAKTNLIPILLNLARRISREQKTKQGTTCLWPPAWQVSYSGAHESDFRWQEGNSPSFEAQQDTGRLNKTVHSSRKLYCFQMDTSFLSAALRQRRDAGGPTSCHHATIVWTKRINSTPAVIWAASLYYSEVSIYMVWCICIDFNSVAWRITFSIART